MIPQHVAGADSEFVLPREALLASHYLTLPIVGKTRLSLLTSVENSAKKVIVISIGRRTSQPLVRIQSKCVYGETFGSRECDCRDQLWQTYHIMNSAGGGILIHLDQEGRGAGLTNKASGYELTQALGLDTFEAYDELGVAHDCRSYADAVRILDLLGVSSCTLLTNNPAKLEALHNGGIAAQREPLLVKPSRLTHDYLQAKRRNGHWL